VRFIDALYFSPAYAPVEISWRSEIARVGAFQRTDYRRAAHAKKVRRRNAYDPVVCAI
jgi:hypothetical protein